MARTKGDAKRSYKKPRTTVRRRIVRRKRRAVRRRGTGPQQFRITKRVTASFIIPEFSTIIGAGAAVYSTLFCTLNTTGIALQAAPYLALYNQCKINAIRYTFRKTTLETTDSAVVGTMTYGHWKDNLPFNGDLLTMVRRPGMKQSRLEASGGRDVCSFKPYVFTPLTYSGGTYAGMRLVRAPFLDNTDVGVTHTGMAVYIDNLPSGQVIQVDVEVSASFKDRR